MANWLLRGGADSNSFQRTNTRALSFDNSDFKPQYECSITALLTLVNRINLREQAYDERQEVTWNVLSRLIQDVSDLQAELRVIIPVCFTNTGPFIAEPIFEGSNISLLMTVDAEILYNRSGGVEQFQSVSYILQAPGQFKSETKSWKVIAEESKKKIIAAINTCYNALSPFVAWEMTEREPKLKRQIPKQKFGTADCYRKWEEVHKLAESCLDQCEELTEEQLYAELEERGWVFRRDLTVGAPEPFEDL